MKQPITVRTSRRPRRRSLGKVLLVALLAFPTLYAVSYVVGRAFTDGATSSGKVVVLHYEGEPQ